MQVALIGLGASGAVGLATYIGNKVKTRIQNLRRPPPVVECVVCGGQVSDPEKLITIMECGHFSHEVCLNAFRTVRIADGLSPECPVEDCRPVARNCVICDGRENGPLKNLDCGHSCHDSCLNIFRFSRSIAGNNPDECPAENCRLPTSMVSSQRNVTEKQPDDESARCLLCSKSSNNLTERRFPCGHIYHEQCLGHLFKSWKLRGITGRDTRKCPHVDCRRSTSDSCHDEDEATSSSSNGDYCTQELSSGNLQSLTNQFEEVPNNADDVCIVCGGLSTSLLPMKEFQCGHKYHNQCFASVISITRATTFNCPHANCVISGTETISGSTVSSVFRKILPPWRKS